MALLRLYGVRIRKQVDSLWVQNRSLIRNLSRLTKVIVTLIVNHSGNVADILHHCFDCLPSFDGIIQGDFIGFGGDDTFCPNTITYVFDEIIHQEIIIAPHTLYATDGDMKDAYVINDMVDMEIFDDTESCKFVQPECWQVDEDFDEIVGFARQMAQLVTFADKKEADRT
jgi:hypothetical protein